MVQSRFDEEKVNPELRSVVGISSGVVVSRL